ncbi:MAG: hypothetical protein B5M53_05830 [Candidatus Cloacimonas sp. 4484_209]|nr:MAG: hypothetical protein B5M53_05830 [Candidatus Cloacimonas sp. 4484_209]
MKKYYPESKVELSGFTAWHYDALLNFLSFGQYSSFIEKAIGQMHINPGDKILDLGAGTGRNACILVRYLSEEGQVIGFDISDEMIVQFERRCKKFPNVNVTNQRIDVELPSVYNDKFDKAFISFVLHGFPQDKRIVIIENVYRALKDGGRFFILDYNEFSYEKKPIYFKIPFKIAECPYAFDFIKRDWKHILTEKGFRNFSAHIFFGGYVRLIEVIKV